MNRRRAVALLLVLVTMAATTVAFVETAVAAYRPPEVPPPQPESIQARTGQVHVSPKIASVGDTITATYSNTGGVTWKLNAPGTCNGEPVKVTGEAAKHSVTGVTGGETSCSWKATQGTKGSWASVSASITGPCGDPQAVREGRAEYAACAGATATDHYYVLGEGAAVTGRVTLSNGRPLPGVAVQLSGPDGGSVRTVGNGAYQFFVGKGSYSISAAGACVAPKARRDKCQSSKSFSVPGSQGVDFVAEREGTIRGRVLDATGQPIGGVTVRVVGPGGTVVQSDGRGQYEAVVPEGAYTVAASREVQADGRTTTQRFCATRRSAAHACETTARVEVPPDQSVGFTPEEDPGLLVDIAGDEIVAGESFAIRITFTNSSETALEGLTFATPDVGLAITAMPLTEGGPPPARSPVARVEGPDPALPTTLGRNESKTVTYQFVALEVGQVELAVSATGKAPDGRDIKGEQVATVSIDERDLTKDDFKKAIQRGTERLLAQAGDQVIDAESLLSQHFETTVDPSLLPKPSAAGIISGREVGLPDAAAGSLSKTVDLGGKMIEAGLSSYGQAVAEGFRAFDLESREVLTAVANAAYDAETRRVLAAELYKEISALPAAALENGGYLTTAIKQAYTPEGWDNILAAWDDASASLKEAAGQVAVGEVELAKQGVEYARTDPIGATKALAYGVGKVQVDVSKTVAGEVLNEVTGRAQSAATGALKRAAYKAAKDTLEKAAVRRATTALAERFRIPSVPGARVPLGDALPGTPTAAATALADSINDEALAKAEAAALKSAQQMDYDTVLSDEHFPDAAGFSNETKADIQDVLRQGRERFGVDVEITARTAEPLSIDVDGHAKEAWMKEKAVGAKDLLLGAPQEAAGQVTVFKPTKLADDLLAGADSRVPDLGKDLKDRYDTQSKNWKSWNDPNSKLRTIVDGASQTNRDGSLRYPKGITVVEALPGNPVPYDIKYLEQLDEIGFRNDLTERLVGEGLSEQQAASRIADVKRQLQRHPEKFVVSPEAVPLGESAFTFRNRLTGKPWRGDVDLESVRPVSGEWPAGRRGEMETWFNHELRKIGRIPMHGYSDAAADLPMEVYPLAGEFRLSHTRTGAAATREAAGMATRFDRMKAELERKAQRTSSQAAQLATDATLTADVAKRTSLEKQARALEAEAQKTRERAQKFDEIKKDLEAYAKGEEGALAGRKSWKPGQKAIVITEGRAVVGAGTGGR